MSALLDRTGRRGPGAATIHSPDPALLRFAVLWATWLGVLAGLTASRALYLVCAASQLAPAPSACGKPAEGAR